MGQGDAVRVAVHYRGNVQGVGFRMTAKREVDGASIVGWVRNEPDGSVRLEAEGKRADVDRFLERIRRAMGDRIEEETTQLRDPLERESTFGIRY